MIDKCSSCMPIIPIRQGFAAGQIQDHIQALPSLYIQRHRHKGTGWQYYEY